MKYADVTICITVNFEDNEIDDLKDQAIEAAYDSTGLHSFEVNSVEVVGKIRDED